MEKQNKIRALHCLYMHWFKEHVTPKLWWLDKQDAFEDLIWSGNSLEESVNQCFSSCPAGCLSLFKKPGRKREAAEERSQDSSSGETSSDEAFDASTEVEDDARASEFSEIQQGCPSVFHMLLDSSYETLANVTSTIEQLVENFGVRALNEGYKVCCCKYCRSKLRHLFMFPKRTCIIGKQTHSFHLLIGNASSGLVSSDVLSATWFDCMCAVRRDSNPHGMPP